MKLLRFLPVLLGLWALPSHAQVTPGGGCGSTQNPCQQSSTTGAFQAGQAVIASTGVAVNLGNHGGLINGILLKACNGPSPEHTNVNAIYYGGSSVTTTGNGVGNGDSIGPGERTSIAVNNSNAVWINGTAGDCVTYSGN
jgi:hypothetical protein